MMDGGAGCHRQFHPSHHRADRPDITRRRWQSAEYGIIRKLYNYAITIVGQNMRDTRRLQNDPAKGGMIATGDPDRGLGLAMHRL